jgi:hypothetical protein
MYMEQLWNDIDRGKPEKLGVKPVLVPLCPPQIPYGLQKQAWYNGSECWALRPKRQTRGLKKHKCDFYVN